MIALFFQSKPTVGGGNGPNPTSLSSNAIHLNSKIATVAISYYSLKSSAINKNPLWTNKFHSVFEMKWVTLNRSILAISVLARVPDFSLYGGHTNTKNMTQKYFFISSFNMRECKYQKIWNRWCTSALFRRYQKLLSKFFWGKTGNFKR